MHYPQTFKKSLQLANNAMTSLSDQRIPANPINFSVWYAYFAGNVTGLKDAIDQRMASGGAFTREDLETLYGTYFSHASEAAELIRTSSRIESSVSQILEHLTSNQAEVADYEKSLDGLSGQLARPIDQAELQGMVGEILTETREFRERSSALDSKLRESTQEIEELKTHLRQVQEEATRDGLTGIANRRLFDMRMSEEIDKAKLEGSDLCLLLFDVDHFKGFNDTYGHTVGDEVLRMVAATLSNNVNGRDLPARYGGEEFALIAPETPIEGAEIMAERIREKFAKNRMRNRRTNQDYGVLTVSVGIARYRFGEPANTLIERADQALYAAKNAGRNKVLSERHLPKAADAA